jgi:hypothetical protein
MIQVTVPMTMKIVKLGLWMMDASGVQGTWTFTAERPAVFVLMVERKPEKVGT